MTCSRIPRCYNTDVHSLSIFSVYTQCGFSRLSLSSSVDAGSRVAKGKGKSISIQGIKRMKKHMWQRMRWGLLLGVALAAGLLCSWGVSQAAGQGPADALPIPSGWQTLDVGQSVWYAFRYTGDKSQIVVDMQLSPAGSASMAVWAPDALYLWERHYPIDPTGQGTVDASRGGDLVWAGSGGFGGLWYLQIQQTGPAPANFSLSISGSGVGLDIPTPVPPTPTYSLPLPAPLIQLPTSTPEPMTRRLRRRSGVRRHRRLGVDGERPSGARRRSWARTWAARSSSRTAAAARSTR